MWQPLGTVTPDFNLWLPFPGDAGSGTVFRLQFISDGNIENVFSYLHLRRVWTPGTFNEKEVELSQKLYPQRHSVILWLPIPPALEFAGLTPAGYEIRKDYRYRKGSYAEPTWYVSLDAFE
jgi:hypothetical protein